MGGLLLGSSGRVHSVPDLRQGGRALSLRCRIHGPPPHHSLQLSEAVGPTNPPSTLSLSASVRSRIVSLLSSRVSTFVRRSAFGLDSRLVSLFIFLPPSALRVGPAGSLC